MSVPEITFQHDYGDEITDIGCVTPLTSIPEVYFQKRFLERQKVMRRKQHRRATFGMAAAWFVAIATLAGIWWRWFR